MKVVRMPLNSIDAVLNSIDERRSTIQSITVVAIAEIDGEVCVVDWRAWTRPEEAHPFLMCGALDSAKFDILSTEIDRD